MEIDIQVNIPGTLLERMQQGALDLVIGSLCETREPGLLLWQEPLVWASSAYLVGRLPTPLPLALFPEPCPYRAVALQRLAQAESPSARQCFARATRRCAQQPCPGSRWRR